jgi:hypothetical protein
MERDVGRHQEEKPDTETGLLLFHPPFFTDNFLLLPKAVFLSDFQFLLTFP